MPEPSLAGRLLVSAPQLRDPNFDRTVVLLLEHTVEGSLGLVLNRPSPVPLAEVLPDWAVVASAPSVLFSGGPVQRSSAICLAKLRPGTEAPTWKPFPGAAGGLGVLDLGQSADALEEQVAGLRVFAGYAGWAGGQLEGELQAGAWHPVDTEEGDALSSDPESLWRIVLRRQGGWLAALAHSPTDASVN